MDTVAACPSEYLGWARKRPRRGEAFRYSAVSTKLPNVLGVESYSCILLATRNGNQQESNVVPVAAVTKVSA